MVCVDWLPFEENLRKMVFLQFQQVAEQRRVFFGPNLIGLHEIEVINPLFITPMVRFEHFVLVSTQIRRGPPPYFRAGLLRILRPQISLGCEFWLSFGTMVSGKFSAKKPRF